MKKYFIWFLAILCLFPSIAEAGSAVGSMGNEIQVGTSTLESPTKFVGTGTIQVNKVGTDTVEISNTATAAWGSIGGTPTDNTYITATPGANKIPFSGSGGNVSWDWIDSTIISIPGTPTQIIGASTNGRWYNLQTSNDNTDAYTNLLLHMNGPDASTTFSDSGVTGHTVTAIGNAQIDTAQSKFGGASGLFDGTGDYLTVSDHDDWTFGSGNWTIDAWVRFNVLNSNDQIILSVGDGVAAGLALFYRWDASAFMLTIDAGVTASLSWSWTPSTATWYHIALVRNGNTWTFYVDGTSKGNQTYSGTLGNYTAIKIGANTSGGGSYFNGWLDEVRISKGRARWTSNFTPPAQEYGYIYYSYSNQYIPPGTTTPVLLMVDDGTSTTKTYTLVNTTTLGVGYGTTTEITGTANSYLIRGKQGAGGLLVDSINTYSSGEIKSIIDAGTRSKFLDSWKNLRIEEWYRKKPEFVNHSADSVLVENQAKERYKQEMYQLWYSQNIDKYKTTIDNNGSTTTFIDVAKLEADYGTTLLDNWYMQNESAYTETEVFAGQSKKIIKPDKLAKAFMDYGELFWMSELEQSKWIEKEKVEIESDTDKLNVSLIVNDPTTPVYMKTKDGIGRDLGSELGSLGIAFQELIKIVEAQGQEIESLRALLSPSASPIPTPIPTP